MKKILLLLSLSVTLVGADLKTNNVTIEWDFNPPEENVQYYKLYYATNLPQGLTWENARVSSTLDWHPSTDSGWTLLAVVAGTTNRITLRQLWTPAAAFFTVTASNMVGESPFSNVAWLPAPPNYRDKKLKLVDLN